jgi:hypothetical protein
LFSVFLVPPTKTNLYIDNSLATAIGDPGLHWVLMFHVPNVLSLFHSLRSTKVSVQAWGIGERFKTY